MASLDLQTSTVQRTMHLRRLQTSCTARGGCYWLARLFWRPRRCPSGGYISLSTEPASVRDADRTDYIAKAPYDQFPALSAGGECARCCRATLIQKAVPRSETDSYLGLRIAPVSPPN